MIDEMLTFLARAPTLGDLSLTWGQAGPRLGTGGVYLRGVKVLQTKTDLLGCQKQRCRAEFLLRLCLPLPPGDDAQALRNAGRLLALQSWVAAQSAAHSLPHFGTGLPEGETLRAVDGRLEKTDSGGTARYTLRLLAEYTEIYKEETP